MKGLAVVPYRKINHGDVMVIITNTHTHKRPKIKDYFSSPSQSFPRNQSPHSQLYSAGLSKLLLQVPPFLHGLAASHIVCLSRK